ncbi:PTS system mannose/fructose/N-acetylgalactosamine-transporter subunit IIB [Holdemania massiliensis]
MVNLVRVDERMLHGQVAMTWVSAVSPNAILIANDDAASNEMSKMAFKMAKPAGVKLAIKSIDEAAVLLNNPKSKEIKIFVITRTIADTLRLANQTSEIHKVNIGGVKKREGAKQISKTTFLNDEDIDNLKALSDLVEEIEIRMVPSDQKVDVKKLIKER